MSAISDNITNVSTVGYKGTSVNFQTLVTKQASTTFYSAGGVQSKPRADVDVQGLLQASSSTTDIAISGNGFYVVNRVSEPTSADEYLYTRAGSFIQDKEGYLVNAAGFFLQGWPTDSTGKVVPADDNLAIANQNIISNDYVETVNLSRVGGTATATSEISIGANLPSDATAGDAYNTDAQFFDSLGNSYTIRFDYERTAVNNNWDLEVEPPSGTSTLALEDTSGNVYDSWGQLEFTARPADGATIVIDGITYEFDSNASVVNTATLRGVDISASTTVSGDVTALVNTIKGFDTDFADYDGYTNTRIAQSTTNTASILFHEDGTKAIAVNPSSLLDSSGNAVTKQTTSFSVAQQNELYSKFTQFKFPVAGPPADGDTMTINGIVYEFDTALDGVGGTNVDVNSNTVALAVANLAAAIEANDPNYTAGGTGVRTRQDANSGVVDTLVLSSLSTGTYNVTFSAGFTNLPSTPSGTAYAASTNYPVDTDYALVFSSSGLPSAINVTSIEIGGFTNGAADMNGGAGNSAQIALDFGTAGEADGMTQFGDTFTPSFITQNGSQFGSFSGVTIGTDGLVTALFDNGETRIIYKVPLATFTNPNGLESKTGNVWSATEFSGDYTLREADNGPTGQIIQASLEASTVDIGEEFTNMIIVQRAYSASTKIITTADQMLEELLRAKR